MEILNSTKSAVVSMLAAEGQGKRESERERERENDWDLDVFYCKEKSYCSFFKVLFVFLMCVALLKPLQDAGSTLYSGNPLTLLP